MNNQEKIEEVDHLKLQLANERLDKARLLYQQTEAQHRAVHGELVAKYKIGPQDTYDVNTLVITRGPKLAEVPPEAKRPKAVK